MSESSLSSALKGILIGLGSIIVIAIIILITSRLLPPSRLQQQSLAAIQAKPIQPGRNAFAAMITLGNPQGLPPVPLPSAAIDYAPALCSFQEAAGCLKKVRSQPQAVENALLTQTALLQHIAELNSFGHYGSPLTPSLTLPLPSIRPLAAPLAAHVQRYLQGDSQSAFAGLCRDAATGRMLMTHSDNLPITISGAAMLSANTKVLASLLAEMPADAQLPAACSTALAVLQPQEMSICNGMRGEFRLSAASFDNQAHPEFQQIKASLLFNADKTKARTAEFLAFSCLPAAQVAIAEDRPQPPVPQPSMMRLECAANYIGCVLTSIAAPAYNGYANKLQDVGAHLRLLQTVLWLREHAPAMRGQPMAIRLQTLPAALQQGPRKISLSADGHALQLPAYAEEPKDQPLSLPIPSALIDAT